MAAGLVLALGGCGGGTDGKADAPEKAAADKRSAKPTPPRPPSRELVKWVGGLCESTRAIKELRTDSTTDLKEIRNPDEELFADARATGYLIDTQMTVDDVDQSLKGLGPSGVPLADRLLDAWQTKLKRVVPRLDEMSPADLDVAAGDATDIDKLVQSLTSPQPDLAALAKKDARLAAAHGRAEQCAPGWKPAEKSASPSPDPTPTGPLPKAADGTNTAACSDGRCEVLVTSSADITANGMSVHVTAGDNSVTFQTASTIMNLGGQGGVAKFGDTLKATVVAQNKDGAVLKFTIP
ncbi:hypothetical protein [Streptomyces sp. NPDC059850]|uniref:hypothetical protein n=1 Tax=Streptomyces sp. NPDC059850 TaxID=3346970 RepID=UPI003657085A